VAGSRRSSGPARLRGRPRAQARALAATGMLPGALRWLAAAERLDPRSAEARFSAGMLHAHMRAWPEAEQALLQAARLHAGDGARLPAALCWLSLGAPRSTQYSQACMAAPSALPARCAGGGGGEAEPDLRGALRAARTWLTPRMHACVRL